MSHPTSESSTKRRKIRKGTASCWECRRRKVRCSLVDSPESVCRACQRRGTKCITQDLPDEGDQDILSAPRAPASPRIRDLGPSSPAVSGSAISHNPTARTRSTHTHVPPRTVPLSAPGHAQTSQHQTPVSEELYASLPLYEDIQVLRKLSADVPITFDAFITVPYSDIEKKGLDETAALLETPSAETHPVLIAKYMLRIAMIFQSLDFKRSGKQLTALSDAPQPMTKRLVETAIRLLTSRDELLGTVEGLQCVMIEGSYHANCGNFRAAWIAFRKAMSLAQVMGIHRPGHGPVRYLDPCRKVDTSFLWYRIIYIDRFMGLMMGLPQGSMDRSMAAEGALATDTPLGRLERLHCVIASRILERNETDLADLDTIREVDYDLQKAADTMPAGWWVVPDSVGQPSADNHSNPVTVHWDILRLLTQIYHYGLINQLHLPFALRFANTDQPQLHEYSQTSCTNASREILTRYAALRSSNRVAHSCRVVDFFTLSSALLLLIAHLRQHARNHDLTCGFNPLAHQRQSDRALVQTAVDNLHKIAWISQDRIIANSADLISRLLAIEAEAARGRAYSTQSIGSPDMVAQELENGPPPGNKGLRFCIPYFGFVKIVPGGPITKEKETGETAGRGVGQLQTPESGEVVGSDMDIHPQPGLFGITGSDLQVQPWYAYPRSTRADDWTLQGLDMTFFDSLFQSFTVPDENASVF
ncbi:uncharacterized protein BDV17DRAFT_297928 [Aspergillus undulatus]|uniref:uncharacterized protein n=1 Tax=Aspergillus undulatus TaxID=1810928 RepID=UPI003CCCCE27